MQALNDYFALLNTMEPGAGEVAIDRSHNLFIMGALLSQKPDDVLELGIGTGYLTVSLVHGLRYNGKGKLTCVDNWGDARGGDMADVAENLRMAGVNVMAPMEERTFLVNSPDNAYDFLISDADHVNSGTWVDEHLRVVRPGGFLFFHDTNNLADYPNMALITQRVRDLGLHHYHFTKSSRPDEQCERGLLFVVKR